MAILFNRLLIISVAFYGDGDIKMGYYIFCTILKNIFLLPAFFIRYWLSGKLPPGKFPPIKLPNENSQPENSQPCFLIFFCFFIIITVVIDIT